MRKRPKRDADSGLPYVTINGQQIDARDRPAIEEAFKQVARLRDRLVLSYAKHFDEDG
ncbi:MAG: hypothetical protein OXM01_07260 [Gemmatimonadota bacterium]|nr:hypothetical protein [Gemmatimonadota bacterium]